MLGITLRMNAARNDLTTSDGAIFDRSTLTNQENRKVSRMVRGWFEKALEHENKKEVT